MANRDKKKIKMLIQATIEEIEKANYNLDIKILIMGVKEKRRYKA